MSQLLEIRKQLNVASQRILDLERSLRAYPDIPSITANLDSAVRIKAKLVAQFSEVAASLGYDIYVYRAFDEYNKPKAGAAFGAIAGFQKLVSVVYGALRFGMKERATVPDYVERETAFDLGYTFSGSVGVVLTIRSDPSLFRDTHLDDTFSNVLSMATSSSRDDISAFASELGPGAINALFQWADSNARAGLGAEIEWRKGEQVQRSILVQRQELTRLRTFIEETSSEVETTEEVTGVLRMADLQTNRFKLKVSGLPLIKGTLARGAIDEHHAATLPQTYVAVLRKTTRFKFSTGREEVRHHLISLKRTSEGN